MHLKKDELQSAVDALAQMPRLRHLLFETSQSKAVLGEITAASMEEIVAACLRRMPLLKRCGHRVDLRRCSIDFLFYNRNYLESHDLALRQQTAIGGHAFQHLQELIFYNFIETPPKISDDVLRMPNLRTLVLRFNQWHPRLLHLLKNVTDLSLMIADRAGALQVLTAIGPQLTKVFFLRVSIWCQVRSI